MVNYFVVKIPILFSRFKEKIPVINNIAGHKTDVVDTFDHNNDFYGASTERSTKRRSFHEIVPIYYNSVSVKELILSNIYTHILSLACLAFCFVKLFKLSWAFCLDCV